MLKPFGISILLLALASVTPAGATGKYNIGFNENWASGYLQYLGKSCSDCPTNSFSADFNSINSLIYDLIKNQHVGVYREIVPLRLLQPTQGSTENYSDIIKILSIYSGYNLYLDLSFGLPIPPWMSVTKDDFLIMPDDAASWTTLRTSMSIAIGNFLNAMWNSPGISRQWISTHLYVEGFNEFDSIQDLKGSNVSSTPARAVDLTSTVTAHLG